MTHRSRSGGPQRSKPKKTKGRKPKLHHPPPPPTDDPSDQPTASHPLAAPDASPSDSDSDEAGVVLPARVLKSTPSRQTILNALDKAIRYDEHFNEHVQKAKSLLFERRWLDLFLDKELLDAYAGRWVPSRALLFRDIMAELKPCRALFSGSAAEEEGEDSEGEDEEDEEGADGENGAEEESAVGEDAVKGNAANGETSTNEGSAVGEESKAEAKEEERLRILSIGGGAGSELLAIAALCVPRRSQVEWTGVDIGDWASVIDRIANAVTDWDIPAKFEFKEVDVLKLPVFSATPTANTDASPTTQPLQTANLPPWLQLKPDLVTIFFTLSELLSQSRPRTINLLRHLTHTMPSGAHLLVVDSASDIAEFPLGNSERTWPAYMILDALLMGLAVEKGSWRRVRAEDSKWWRLEGGERWGRCKLENARYWLRLYERV